MARAFKEMLLDHVQSSDSVHVTVSATRYFLMLSPAPAAAEAELAELLPPDQKFILSIQDRPVGMGLVTSEGARP